MPETLSELAKDEYTGTRIGAAANPNTPLTTLEVLSKDESYKVRIEVAKNRFTPVRVLMALSDDFYVPIRVEVVKNPNTPKNVLEKLAKIDTEGQSPKLEENIDNQKRIIYITITSSQNNSKQFILELLKDEKIVNIQIDEI